MAENEINTDCIIQCIMKPVARLQFSCADGTNGGVRGR